MEENKEIKIATNDVLIVQCGMHRRPEELERFRNELMKQKESGVVIIPFDCEWGVLHRDSVIIGG